jgi:hypothetical protein
MRLWVIALLLVIPFSSALIVESTGRAGERPVMYGDNIVYERAGSIYVYDIAKHEERELSRGASPSLFAFVAAFETREADKDLNGDGDVDDTVIQFANVKDGNIVSTNAIGHNPYIWSKFIVFSTNEAEMGVDFSNDGDMTDDIIREYDIDKKETANLKAVGSLPAVNQKVILFVTDEAQVGTDLNGDGDKSDSVLRVLDKESRKVSNEKLVASRPLITKTGKAVFTSGSDIVVFDVVEQKSSKIAQKGSSPALFDDVIIFERDGNLYGFSLRNAALADLKLRGASPTMFENKIAFVSSEKDVGDLNNNGNGDDFIIRYAKEEDIDGDDVYDFSDNCQSMINDDQNDGDNDGIGDACDKETPKPKKGEVKESSTPVPENASEQPSESSGIPWYIYLIVIILLPFVAYYGYKYYKKRQKSFGF